MTATGTRKNDKNYKIIIVRQRTEYEFVRAVIIRFEDSIERRFSPSKTIENYRSRTFKMYSNCPVQV